MAKEPKQALPPYATYKSFSNFIKGLRDAKAVPTHIGRSILPGSNSGKASIYYALRAMSLIDDKDKPTKQLTQLADPEANYSEELKKVVENTYDFVNDENFDLANTITEKVIDKFKDAGASGSTITKCMAFFLAAAKDAAIDVSPHVKTPQPLVSSKRKASPRKETPAPSARPEDPPPAREKPKHENMDRIVISVHGMKDWIIYVPSGLTEAQWKHGLKVAMFNLDNYRAPEEDGNNES